MIEDQFLQVKFSLLHIDYLGVICHHYTYPIFKSLFIKWLLAELLLAF